MICVCCLFLHRSYDFAYHPDQHFLVFNCVWVQAYLHPLNNSQRCYVCVYVCVCIYIYRYIKREFVKVSQRDKEDKKKEHKREISAQRKPNDRKRTKARGRQRVNPGVWTSAEASGNSVPSWLKVEVLHVGTKSCQNTAHTSMQCCEENTDR